MPSLVVFMIISSIICSRVVTACPFAIFSIFVSNHLNKLKSFLMKCGCVKLAITSVHWMAVHRWHLDADGWREKEQEKSTLSLILWRQFYQSRSIQTIRMQTHKLWSLEEASRVLHGIDGKCEWKAEKKEKKIFDINEFVRHHVIHTMRQPKCKVRRPIETRELSVVIFTCNEFIFFSLFRLTANIPSAWHSPRETWSHRMIVCIKTYSVLLVVVGRVRIADAHIWQSQDHCIRGKMKTSSY